MRPVLTQMAAQGLQPDFLHYFAHFYKLYWPAGERQVWYLSSGLYNPLMA
jgi:hypothetical protein